MAAAGLAKPASAALWFSEERRYPLLIGGSSTMLHFTAALVDAFSKSHPNVDVVVMGGGSAPGLMALKRGAIDLAAMSQDMTVAQDEMNVHNYLLARDAIGVVVNPANPAQGLSASQAAAIFEGKIANWRDVGGNNAPISVVARPAKATTRIAADAMVLNDGDLTENALIVPDSPGMTAAIATNPNAIGYLTLRRFTAEVKTLPINGVGIRRETILTGRYPFTRSFFYVLQGDGPPSALAFLEFAIGPAGRDILASIDLIPAF